MSSEVDRLLSEAVQSSHDSGADLCNQAYAAHLRDRNKPHLAFSAAIAHVLRSSGESNAFVCRDLLRNLKASARFGETPPRSRPENVDRWDFVRELSSQAGISLDLARLSFLQRKDRHRRHRAEVETAALAITDAEQGEDGSTSTSQQARSAAGWSYKQDEVERLLTRAGQYLREVQRDMEFLRDHADKLAAQVRRVALQKAEQNAAASTAPAAAAPADVAPEDMDEADHVEALLKMTENAIATAAAPEAVSVEVAKAPPPLQDVVPQEGAESATRTAVPELPPGIDQNGLVDDLIIPTFGQFLEKQLLPLYVRDIPFHTLQHLTDHYCGVTLDSDDEREALKAAGGSSTSQKVKSKGPGRRLVRSATADSVASEASQSPTASRPALRDRAREKEEPLGQLIQAAEKTTAMRAQMANSVVEKRKVGKPALPDVIAARPSRKPAASLRETSMAPPSARPEKRHSHVMSTPRVSKALLLSPTTTSAAKKRRLMISPVQWRSRTSAAEARLPVPSPVASATATANFDAFDDDTPWKAKKGSGLEFE